MRHRTLGQHPPVRRRGEQLVQNAGPVIGVVPVDQHAAFAIAYRGDQTADGLLRVYREAVTEHRALIAARLEAYAW